MPAGRNTREGRGEREHGKDREEKEAESDSEREGAAEREREGSGEWVKESERMRRLCNGAARGPVLTSSGGPCFVCSQSPCHTARRTRPEGRFGEGQHHLLPHQGTTLTQSSGSNCQDGGSEASLLVSPLVVAGIVIGLVLFLSCVTIIVGSLRKDGRLRNPHLRHSYAPDGFSYGGSIGELRSTCIEDFPPAFDFDSYVESLSQVNVMYPDSPPQYEECVGPGATQIYVPTDDPPPYSLTDPCQGRDMSATLSSLEMEEVSGGASSVTGRLHPIASISLSAFPLEDAPPYETVVSSPCQPIPLIPTDLLKHASVDTSSQQPVSQRTLLSGPASPPRVPQ
ncbi:hypothetical protein JZ751_019388 [Albula glossodonta]|uniref:Brain expressed, associated with NEDD4, 1 n=1 Tax=Albula glossodonta TaxID=121402 RepID=A0A8T2NNU2_9TELE|nr:hypothetical protein JZ751_019388 [Albula glossodonta]